MKDIRLAFVGVGSMGQAAHLRNYLTLPGCRVVALAEKRPQLAQEVARRFDIPSVYEGHGELLLNEVVDGIVAIQQFQTHAALVPQLLAKGVPVLIEKPLAATIPQGQQLLAAVQARSTPLYLAYHKRSDPAIAYAKQTILDWSLTGEAGSLRYIRITMPPGDWSAQAFASNVTTIETYEIDPVPSGWGNYIAFVNYYIHQVNLFRFLLDEDYEVAFADRAGITMTAQSSRGVTGVLEMAPFATTSDWQESVLIAFEKAWIRVELPAPLAIDQAGQVTVFQEGKSGPLKLCPILPAWHAMRMQAANFLRAIRGEPHPLCGAEDGMKDLIVASQYLDKLRESQA